MDRLAPFAAIVVLLLWRRPATVRRFIIAVVFDAVEAMSGARASAHISKKVDVIAPSFAHRNPSASVVFPSFIFGIAAAIVHIYPGGIFHRSSAFSVSSGGWHGLLALAFGQFFLTETPTGFRSSFSKVGAGDKVLFAAIAKASPFLTVLKIFYSDKTPKSLIGNIDEARHVY